MNRLVSTLVMATVTACTQQPVEPPPPVVTDPSLTVTRDGPALPFDHPAILGGGSAGGGNAGGGSTGGSGGSGGGMVVTGPASAGSQRLSVRQLANSMPIALGGSTWMVSSTTTGFNGRTRTLGEPDYIAIVDENLEPSALFLKFMDDAAKDGCNRALAADATAAATARVLYKSVSLTDTLATNRAGIDQNLAYLKLRFHGVKVPVTDDATLAPLRKLFDDAQKAAQGTATTATAAHVKEGWRAVCVALLMAPEYHLY